MKKKVFYFIDMIYVIEIYSLSDLYKYMYIERFNIRIQFPNSHDEIFQNIIANISIFFKNRKKVKV